MHLEISVKCQTICKIMTDWNIWIRIWICAKQMLTSQFWTHALFVKSGPWPLMPVGYTLFTGQGLWGGLASFHSQAGGCFNIMMSSYQSSYQYRKSHYGDKTTLRPSYLHNGIPILVRWHLHFESGPRWAKCPCGCTLLRSVLPIGQLNPYYHDHE